jgi:hypothetical protein
MVYFSPLQRIMLKFLFAFRKQNWYLALLLSSSVLFKQMPSCGPTCQVPHTMLLYSLSTACVLGHQWDHEFGTALPS